MRPLAALLLLIAISVACIGPKPEVRSAEVAPPKEGKATVTVVIVNTGSGDGQVELKVTLRDAGGNVVARDEKTTELKERETVTVVLDVDVPADAKDLKVDAEVTYPPD